MDPENLGELDVSLTKDDLADFLAYTTLHSRFAEGATIAWRVRCVLIVISAVLLVAAVQTNFGVIGGSPLVSAWPTLGALLLLTLALAWICYPDLLRMRYRRQVQQGRCDNWFVPTHVAIKHEGISTTSTMGSTFSTWPAIIEIAQTANAVYAYLSTYQAYIFPHGAFANAQAFGAFADDLRQWRGLIAYPPGQRWRAVLRQLAVPVVGFCCFMATIAALAIQAGTSQAAFIGEFDRNMRGAPVEAAVLAADPAFRTRVLESEVVAYSHGGWPAANDMLHDMMREKQPQVTWTLIHGDDALVTALWKHYDATIKQLADKPAACRSYADGNGDQGASSSSGDDIRAGAAAKLAAFQSGVANLAAGNAAPIPSRDTLNWLFEELASLGFAYTADERAVIDRTVGRRKLPDSVVCSAYLKFYASLFQLPTSEAAQLIRYHWAP